MLGHSRWSGFLRHHCWIPMLLLLAGESAAQVVRTDWPLGTGARDDAAAAAVCPDGAVVIVGHTLGTFAGYSNQGSFDLFLAKHDGTDWTWVKQPPEISSTGEDIAYDMAVDAAGNIYIVGYTKGSIPPYSNQGGRDYFLSKLDPNGDWLWTVQDGLGGNDQARNVAIGPQGDVYISGNTYGNLHGEINSGSADFFLVQYDSQLNWQNTRLWGSSAYEDPAFLAIDPAGFVYVTGATFGSLGGPNQGQDDIAVGKFDLNGNYLDSDQYGDTSREQGLGIAVDATTGDVYVSIFTQGSLFDTNQGGYDSGLMRLDTQLGVQWGRQWGSGGQDDGYAAALVPGPAGAAYVGGLTKGTLPGCVSSGGSDATLVKVSLDGTILWMTQWGSSGNDFTIEVVADSQGDVFAPGAVNGPLPGQVSYGSTDAFLSRFQESRPIADAGMDQENAHPGDFVTLDGSGSTDPDGHYPLGYYWTFLSIPAGSTATLSDPYAVKPWFVPDILGAYSVELVVTNSQGVSSAPDQVTASASNSAPIADAGPDQSVITQGSTIQLNGSQSYDPDGDGFSFWWVLAGIPSGSAAVLDDPSLANPTFVADAQGTYSAVLVVTDVYGAVSDPDAIQVSFQNVAPIAHAGPNQTVTSGSLVALDGSESSDDNDDPLLFAWDFVFRPVGSLAQLSALTAPQTSFIADVAGTYVIALVVSDGLENSVAATVTVTAVPAPDCATTAIFDAVEAINGLDDSSFKNKKMRNALTNKLGAVLSMLEAGQTNGAKNKLTQDLIAKTDGCATSGTPDKNDWILDSEDQALVYGLLVAICDCLDPS